MTAPLTGRAIEWAKTLTEMRRPHARRKGELNGPFSWWAVFDAFVILLIALAMTYIGFMLGRWYCEASHDTPVSQTSIARSIKRII